MDSNVPQMNSSDQTNAADLVFAAHQASINGDRFMSAGKYEQATAEYTRAAQLHYQHLRHTQTGLERASEQYLESIRARYQQRKQQFASEYPWLVLPWEDPAWEQYSLEAQAPIASAVRVGRFDLPQATGLGEVPALIPLLGQRHLFLTGEAQAARQLLLTILLRQCVSTPAGSLRVILFDPLPKKDDQPNFESLVNNLPDGKLLTQPEEIDSAWIELHQSIEDILHHHLRDEFLSIDAYNAQPGIEAIPYTLLVLAGLPASILHNQGEKLVQLAQDGKRAGVFLLAYLDPTDSVSQDLFQTANLPQLGNVLHYEGKEHWRLDDTELGQYAIIADHLPALERCRLWLKPTSQPEFLSFLHTSPAAPGTPAKIWLGESTLAVLERYPCSHLLILGDDENRAYVLLANSLLSLHVQREACQASFIIGDFTRPSSTLKDFFPTFANIFHSDTVTILGPRQVNQALERLLDELIHRKASPAEQHHDLYFLIAGLQRWRELRPLVADSGTTITSPMAAQMLSILEDGAELGIHLVAWCDGLAFLDQAFNQRGLDAFDYRVGLNLSIGEANRMCRGLVTLPASAESAIFRNENDPLAQFHPFTPYPIPDVENLQKIIT
jgi:hypothetical protein